jgi:hypothetical protein
MAPIHEPVWQRQGTPAPSPNALIALAFAAMVVISAVALLIDGIG